MNIISNKVIPEFKDIEVVNALYANNSKIQTLGMSQEALKKKAKEIAHSNASAALLAYKFAHEKVQGVKQQAALRSDLIDNPVELVQAARKTWEDIQETEVSARSLETRSSVHDAPISTDQAFYNARLIFARSKLASVQNPGISYHPTYTSPENWVDPSAKSGWPLLTIPVANTDTEVNLSITFSRVDITRPWLLASLFELKGWKNAQGPGSLSKGKLKDNDGSFSLLPQSMIVARDIVARTSTGDIVFRALGLQVLAYISKLVPFSPPSS